MLGPVGVAKYNNGVTNCPQCRATLPHKGVAKYGLLAVQVPQAMDDDLDDEYQ
jgi:hypothetical protein